jgi:hypothetical protein
MIIKTIILSIIIVALCLVGLSIGLILTGKPKLKKGCGKLPKDPGCDKESCDICSPKDKKSKKN